MKRIKEIAETRVRYGYRRIHVLLRREGWLVNAKRVCRLYREKGLQLRNKSPKRRVKAQLREDRAPATAANQVWAMDGLCSRPAVRWPQDPHSDPLWAGKLGFISPIDLFKSFCSGRVLAAGHGKRSALSELRRVSRSQLDWVTGSPPVSGDVSRLLQQTSVSTVVLS